MEHITRQTPFRIRRFALVDLRFLRRAELDLELVAEGEEAAGCLWVVVVGEGGEEERGEGIRRRRERIRPRRTISRL